MRVLLVESVGASPALRLGDNYDVVACAEDADEAMSILRRDCFDLILLNMSVHVQDGLDLIRRLRASRDGTPLLALTVETAADRIKALDAGADDAQAEPLEYAELHARIIAISRRARGFSHSLLTLGHLSLCLIMMEARFQDKLVPLTPKEFAILKLMFLRRGTIITRATVLHHLYPDIDEQPDIRIIDVIICKLRKKFEKIGCIGLVDTVWGEGYIMRDPISIRRRSASSPVHSELSNLLEYKLCTNTSTPKFRVRTD